MVLRVLLKINRYDIRVITVWIKWIFLLCDDCIEMLGITICAIRNI